MLWSVAAASASEIDESGAGEVAEVSIHVLREFWKAGRGKWVRHTGVRVAGDIGLGNTGKLLNEGAHLVWSERAIEANGERVDMGDGIPKSFNFLCRDHCFTTHSNCGGDNDGELKASFLKDVLNRDEGSFGIEGIENGFDHEDV